jgi:hypothetical protein
MAYTITRLMPATDPKRHLVRRVRAALIAAKRHYRALFMDP